MLLLELDSHDLNDFCNQCSLVVCPGGTVKDYTVLKAFLFSKCLIYSKASAFTIYKMQLALLINVTASIFLFHRKTRNKDLIIKIRW